ncbi:MAG: hypothetical protein QOD72_3283 [Acidimicrobiaceae bacterium]|nr:hypothetical protein [Acidimicrobiaceae bacterium]
MQTPPEVVEFQPGDPEEVVAAMADLASARHGWITLRPGVDPEDAPPPRSVLGALFAGTGPPVPVCTWVAPEQRQKPPHPELGILHKSGPKAARTLADAGIDIPEHWVVLSDHPRRGLVVAVHPDSAHGDVLDWLLRAGAALTRVPLTGTWQAAIHGRRT